MTTFIEVEAFERKRKFLKKFTDGFKKLESAATELKKLRIQQLRYMAEWATRNELLLRGQVGYYKITPKGLEWIALADEVVKSGVLQNLKKIQKMAPKNWRKTKTKRKKTKKPLCADNGSCRLIKT